MELLLRDRLEIFWQESHLYIGGLAVHALVLRAIIGLIGSRYRAPVESEKLLAINGLYYCLRIVLLAARTANRSIQAG